MAANTVGTTKKTTKNKHVAVLMGGWSAERPVSLKSGEACAKALEQEGYRVTRVDVDRNLTQVLTSLKPDVAFNALHGPFGEDGVVQGLLEMLQIPYTHSGVLSSALAMHKQQAKVVMQAAGVPVAEGLVVDRREAAKRHLMAPPYVIKPVAEGSSFGVFIITQKNEKLPKQLTSDEWKMGDMVLVERYVPGRELTCAVMGDVALGVTEIIPTAPFYDYEAKYQPGGSQHVCPAQVSPRIYQEIQSLALKAHKALGCRGVTRSDFRYDDGPNGTGEVICLEVNTQPGMTGTSLVPELAAHAGHPFHELVKWIAEDASCNR